MIPIRGGHINHGYSFGATGNVDQDVDAVPAVEGGLHHVADRFLIRHVGNERNGIGALGGQFSSHRVRCFRIDIRNGDLGAFRREAAGYRAADAAPAAGDDRDLVLDCPHDFFTPISSDAKAHQTRECAGPSDG